MALPLRLPWKLAEDRWASDINPVINFPPNNGILLKNIAIVTGVNVINHLLQRNQQGWIVNDIDAPVTLYRSQPFNNLTLTLTSSGSANISLWVW